MKRFNLALFAFCFCSIAWAQFYSSERVYCYEYVETINDGIKSKERKGSLYFCNIQKDILGLISATKEQARIKLVDDPDYYNEKARSIVASSYKDWNRVPSNYGVFAGVYAYITNIVLNVLLTPLIRTEMLENRRLSILYIQLQLTGGMNIGPIIAIHSLRIGNN